MAETTINGAGTAARLGRKEEGAMLGVSKTSRYIAHAVLILGVLIVAFPIYYTFVASTHSLQTILRPPLPLLPGDRFFENYYQAIFGGVRQTGGVGADLLLFNTTASRWARSPFLCSRPMRSSSSGFQVGCSSSG
jgi:sn-glycerol 3-phosphate transport system permease protein